MNFSLSFSRRASAIAALSLVLLSVPVAAQLPALGEGGELTTSAERKIGEKVAKELYRDPDYIDDPMLVEYVGGIWNKLLDAARTRGEITSELDERYPWQVLLGKDHTINAFAVPGGFLGLHCGLIAVTASPDELAAVLGHELSHVTQRHISRMMEQDSKQTPLMIAAMLLGALAVTRSPDAGGALIAGSQAVVAHNQLSFSRDMEREADRIGFGVMTQAGYSPRGFVTMFEKLQQASRLNNSDAFPYLQNHPLTSERIAEMQARQQLGSDIPEHYTMEHALAASRARVLSNVGIDSLRAMAAEADAPGLAAQPRNRQAATLYSATFAASMLHEPATVAKLLPRLQAAVAGDAAGERWARLLDAELALGAGDANRVLRLVDAKSERRPEVLLSTQAEVLTGQAKDAGERLQTWVTSHPRDAGAWQELAGAYSAQGQQVRAVRAEGEARAAQLDFTAALDRMRAAQDLVRRNVGGGDHIDASIIDARARELQSRVKEDALQR